jgi:hypothetical protein
MREPSQGITVPVGTAPVPEVHQRRRQRLELRDWAAKSAIDRAEADFQEQTARPAAEPGERKEATDA